MSTQKPVAQVTTEKPRGQSSSLLSALIIGLPLGIALVAVLRLGPWQGTILDRYSSHPVEKVEIVIFCCALGALIGKVFGYVRQKYALQRDLLPEWNGQAIPVSEAPSLLAHISRLPGMVRRSWVGKRTYEILSFVCRRKSASELDDHIRTVSDNDALNLESSYSLVRFLIWSMPILGFLGTVLGIAGAIAGVSPEVLEQSISTVTQGLALAFDTTGLALILTIVTMFCNFVVERMETSVLQQVDEHTDLHLTHRFARPEGDQGPIMDAVAQSTQAIIAATEQLVERQASLWASTMTEADRRRLETEKGQQQRLTQALEVALERTLATHQERLVTMQQEMGKQTASTLQPFQALAKTLQEHQSALQPVSKTTHELVQVLAQMQKQEGQLARLQQLLQQNLASLASSGNFEQAVHSLTAAIHLLTARSAAPMPTPGLRVVSDDNAA